MEKSCHSSGGGDSTVTSSASTNSRNSCTTDMYLKHLNKLSHKVSKPIRRQSSPTVDPPRLNLNRSNEPVVAQSQPLDHQQQVQQQPPVYTINRNDFRDVVQRLTGSPAHERSGSPAREPVLQQPKLKPSSSRLQKIRPPPLAQISNRPPNMLNCAAVPSAFFGVPRQPLSPLPPFPTVHAAAESPVSAYMRFFKNSFAVFPVPPLGSPRWITGTPPQPPPSYQQNIPPPPPPPQHNHHQPLTGAQPFAYFPSSPLPSSGMFSPSFLFSPGQLSPTLPVTSPRWMGH